MKYKRNIKILLVGVLFCILLSFSSNLNIVRAETTEEESVIFNMGGQQMSSFTTLDPLTYMSMPEMDIIFNVLEGLTTWVTHADGSTSIDPCLATSWEFEDIVTLNVHLREGASFTDGTPWNATTCEWNWDRLANLYAWSGFAGVLSLPADPFRDVSGVDLSWAPGGAYIYPINHTEITGEYDITFHLNVPYDLMNIIGPHYRMISPTTFADYLCQYMPATWLGNELSEVLDLGLVGTGAYYLDEINFNEETTTLLKNPDWWGPEATIDVLNYRYYASGEDTMTLALVSGELDAATYINKDIIEGKSNIVYLGDPQVGVGQMICMLPEKVNISVREALNYAFNDQYFLDEVLGGEGVLAPGAIFLEQTYSDDSVHPPRFNLTRAREVLIDSGIAPAGASEWTNDDWLDVADGDGSVGPLGNYTLGYMDNYGMPDWAASMQSAARTVGINISLVIESEATYFNTILNRTEVGKKYDMFCGMMGMSSAVEMTLLMMYSSSAFYGLSMPLGGVPEVDEAIWNFMKASPEDTETRQTYANQVADRINNELFYFAWIPVGNFPCAYSNEWTNISSLIDTRPWQWVPVTENGNDEEKVSVPGFSLIFLGFASAVGVIAIIKKKRE